MKIFITGATGFIGSHLVPLLVANGHELHCLVRRTSPLGGLEARDVHLVYGDVNDKASVLAGMRGCDWVVHLANVFSFWERDRQVYRRVNVDGTRNVMEAALEAGVSKVAHVSSVVVYGKSAVVPFNEESPPGPERFSQYARTKYEGEQIVWQLYQSRGLPVVVIYPVNVLGPGNAKPIGNYVKDITNRRLPGVPYGDSFHSFVDVRDVAEVILRALQTEDNLGQKYFASGHQATFRDFTHLVAEIAGVRPPGREIGNGTLLLMSRLATLMADLSGRPPLLGMATEGIKSGIVGFRADGSKAQSALGVSYTPLRTTVQDELNALQ